MNAWKTELEAVLRGMFGNPLSDKELVVLAVAAVLVCILGLRVASGVFGLKRTSWWAVLTVFILTTAVALAAVVATRIFLLNAGSSIATRVGLQIGAAVLVVLVIGIPLQMLLQRGNYFESLSCFVTTSIVAALLTAGVHAAFQAVKAGGTQMNRAAERNKQTDVESEGLLK